MRASAGLGLVLVAAALALLAALPGVLAAAGQLHVRVRLDNATTLCVLDGAGLGLTTITKADLAPFVGVQCDSRPITVLDLSRNSLGAAGSIGPDLLTGFARPMAIDLSHNLLTHDAIDGLFNPAAPGGCAFCGVTVSAIDLGYNNIGPAFPLALRQIPGARVALYLISCGITDVPSEVLLGSKIATLDLSLNDLRGGLHPFSFAGATGTASVSCAYCNLRSASMPVGVLDVAASAEVAAMLNLANDITPALDGEYLPRTWANDSRLFTKDRFTPPKATSYVHRLPTPEEYLTSWSNCFEVFPVSVFKPAPAGTAAPSGANYTVPTWKSLAVGDVVSFGSGAFNSVKDLNLVALVMTLDLAPQVAAVALGLDTTAGLFCPFHSWANSTTEEDGIWIGGFDLRAYDQPLPSVCAFPACVKTKRCPYHSLTGVGSLQLATEPAFLVREVGSWLEAMWFIDTLIWGRPKWDLWNPALNRSDWVEPDALCDLKVDRLTLPALPFSRDPAQASWSIAAPDGMLSCVSTLTKAIDWSGVKVFSGEMLRGLRPTAPITLTLDIQALYTADTLSPPLGFFDALVSRTELVKLVADPACQPADLSLGCIRMSSTCPAWFGLCVDCAPGGTADNFAVGTLVQKYYYCAACPIGHRCDSQESPSPIECEAGTFQPLRGQSFCRKCPVGTYSDLTGRAEPYACVNCHPGRWNPQEGGSSLDTACLPCPPGSASAVSGVSLCTSCRGGEFQSNPGSYHCDLCSPGRFSGAYNAKDESTCERCPAATPQSIAGSSSVQQCTPLSKWCPEGFYTASGGRQCATPCPRGSTCVDGVITECPAGSFTDAEQQTVCKPCGPGRFGSVNGSVTVADCSPCQPSAYSSSNVTAVCNLCPVGRASAVRGATTNSSCMLVPSCLTARSIGDGSSPPAAEALYCALGATSPIHLSQLLSGGVSTLRAYMNMTVSLSNSSSSSSGAASAIAEATQQAAFKLTNAMGAWPPLKLAPSLRLAAFKEDAVLSAFDATAAAFSNTSTAGVVDATKSALDDISLYVLFTLLLCFAFLPWLAYRWMPARIVLYLDQFKLHHLTRIGESAVNSPTQLGAIVTWSFIWVAILVAVLLGTESNTISTTELVPPSAAEYSDTARAHWQITLRAYTGDPPEVMAQWCHARPDSRLLQDQTGLTSALTLRTAAASTDGRQSCDIAADCFDCGMNTAAYVYFSLPFNAQLVEWELWINSAQKNSWSRAYGLHAAPPGSLLPAQSVIAFTAIESYFVDARTAASTLSFSGPSSAGRSSGSRTRASRSGFDFSFVITLALAAQPLQTFSASSSTQVGLTFAFRKSDVLLRTQLANKQTALQIMAVIASTVVSLFALFGLAFKLLEAQLFKRCGWTPGPVVHDAQGVARLSDAPHFAKTPADLSEPLMDGQAEQEEPARCDLELSSSLSFIGRPRLSPPPPPPPATRRALSESQAEL